MNTMQLSHSNFPTAAPPRSSGTRSPVASVARLGSPDARIRLTPPAFSVVLARCAHSRVLQTGSCRRLRHVVLSKARDVESKHTICILGEALFDCLADQKGKSREEVTSWTPYPGGAPANVACALAQLGSEVVFIGNLGQDDLGDQMADLLTSRGIDLSCLHRTKQPTRDVLVTRSLEGDREFVGFGAAAADAYADCFIDPEKLPAETLQVADLLVTGTLGLAYSQTAAAMHRAVELARKSPTCEVLVDVNWRPAFFEGQLDTAKDKILPYIAGADVLKVTDEEAEFLFGIPAADALEHPDKVLANLPKAKGVLVTAGALGSSFCFRGKNGKGDISARVPVLKVDVLDTTGAGDGFLGGWMHYTVKKGGLSALLEDADEVKKAVEFGTACGAYVTQGPGAIAPQPTEADVAQFLGKNWDFEIAPKEYFSLAA